MKFTAHLYNDEYSLNSTLAVSAYPLHGILVESSRECPKQVVRVGFVEFGERHDTRTNGQRNTPKPTAGQPIR